MGEGLSRLKDIKTVTERNGRKMSVVQTDLTSLMQEGIGSLFPQHTRLLL